MVDNLKKQFGEQSRTSSPEVLKKYSIAGKAPSVLLFPHSGNQVAAMLKLAKRERKKVLVAGNNSQHFFGAAIEAPDWCLSLRRMNQIIDHEAADLIVTVEAGVSLPQLQKFLAQHNQFLPLDPPGAQDRTLGGIVATNSFGALRTRYGTCRDLVLGMSVALADGTLIRAGGKTVKNVAGYDLSKLFIGSLGTLGVITEITFKLFPVLPRSRTLRAGFDQLTEIQKLIASVFSSNLVIGRCQYSNAILAERVPGKKIASNKAHYLLFQLQGHDEMVAAASEKLTRLLSANGGKEIEIIEDRNETQLWNQVNRLKFNDTPLEYDTHLRISVSRANFAPLISQVTDYARENHLTLAIQSYPADGIVDLFRIAGEAGVASEGLAGFIHSMRRIATGHGGILVVQQAPADTLRTPNHIWGEPGKDFGLLRQIKTQYDPDRILVPGRFIGGL